MYASFLVADVAALALASLLLSGRICAIDVAGIAQLYEGTFVRRLLVATRGDCYKSFSY